MCGIVGAVANRDIAPILLAGLARLEYRGYDSAGLAMVNEQQQIQRLRVQGKVSQLSALYEQRPVHGQTGIAHTRWATHGAPSEDNAHPHVSHNEISVVHNGIIENHEELRERLAAAGYEFSSETDSELIAHCVHYHLNLGKELLAAAEASCTELEGAFAIAIIRDAEPGRMIAMRSGSPLVIGVGVGEHFLASDPLALLPVTQEFIYLEDGDVADIRCDQCHIHDAAGETVMREHYHSSQQSDVNDKGDYRHYMQKEIAEQPQAISDTLEARLGNERVLPGICGDKAEQIFDHVQRLQIVACGTSYHAGLVAKYWCESFAGIPCYVEIASEFRYRDLIVEDNTLFVTISQSGETADTLAALHKAKTQGYLASLAVCNVPESSLVRESDCVLMTRAGVEIGVASTKAFTTQLTALLCLIISLGRRHQLTEQCEAELVAQLKELPRLAQEILELDAQVEALATRFADKQHALFLGRGSHYPVALEGALKLKEISYIHAEAYPAGELKHGPLALVDKEMPVIAVAPNNQLLEKLKSNLHEVRARGGQLYVFADESINIKAMEGLTVIALPSVANVIAPIVYTIPLQQLAYHVAVLKGTDVDQPRNLAKSVTVE